jgi:hypothetical protein
LILGIYGDSAFNLLSELNALSPQSKAKVQNHRIGREIMSDANDKKAAKWGQKN